MEHGVGGRYGDENGCWVGLMGWIEAAFEVAQPQNKNVFGILQTLGKVKKPHGSSANILKHRIIESPRLMPSLYFDPPPPLLPHPQAARVGQSPRFPSEPPPYLTSTRAGKQKTPQWLNDLLGVEEPTQQGGGLTMKDFFDGKTYE